MFLRGSTIYPTLARWPGTLGRETQCLSGLPKSLIRVSVTLFERQRVGTPRRRLSRRTVLRLGGQPAEHWQNGIFPYLRRYLRRYLQRFPKKGSSDGTDGIFTVSSTVSSMVSSHGSALRMKPSPTTLLFVSYLRIFVVSYLTTCSLDSTPPFHTHLISEPFRPRRTSEIWRRVTVVPCRTVGYASPRRPHRTPARGRRG